MSDSTQIFQATAAELQVFNRQPIINAGFEFFYTDCDGDEQDYEIPGFVSAYTKVYNERLGRVIKTWDLTLSGTSILILNTQDVSFPTNGVYWYEVYYIMTGGYEIRLRYGKLIVK